MNCILGVNCMSWMRCARTFTFLVSAIVCAAPLAAQGVTNEMLSILREIAGPVFMAITRGSAIAR